MFISFEECSAQEGGCSLEEANVAMNPNPLPVQTAFTDGAS